MAGNGVTRRTRLSGAERRIQIIEAAGALISFSGYWAVSLHDIGLQCGVTNAAVLHHFGSKEKLLMAVLAHRDEVDRIALATGLGVERADLYAVLPTIDLSMICAAMVRRNAQQPEIVRLYALLSAESLDPHHPAHEYYQKREATAISTFASAKAPGGNSPELARLVLAAMDGVQLRWLRNLDSIDLVADWELASRRILSGS